MVKQRGHLMRMTFRLMILVHHLMITINRLHNWFP
jgi:hypothetical protein